MQQTGKNDFCTGSISANILRLAVPMTLAQLINVLYSVVDRIYIGHIPTASADALTGMGLALPVVTILTAFANLFGMGGAPLFSMARGAGNEERAARIMGNVFSMLALSGMLLSAACMIFRRPMLFLFGASDATYPYANAYITIYLLGTLFVMISLGMNGFINAQGFGVTGMLTVSIGAVLNLLLDPLLIFGLGMGIRGAAVATVLSQLVSATWVLRFLTGKRAVIRLERQYLAIHLPLVREIAALGASGFIMSATNGLVQVACNATLQRYGGDLYVGVMTILNSVRELVTMPLNGLTSGAQPVISYNYGARQYSRVKSAIRFAAAVSVVLTCTVWALLLLFPRFFILLFNSDEPALLRAGVPAMHLYFFGIFMMALQFAGQSTFVALGRSRQAIFFSLLRKAVIVTPLTLLLPRVGGLGVSGVFLAEPVSNFAGGAACFITMLCTVWPTLGRPDKQRPAA